jgi:hypothetical protein
MNSNELNHLNETIHLNESKLLNYKLKKLKIVKFF